jgi:hypothetical protein
MFLRVQLFTLVAFALSAAVLFCGGTRSLAQKADNDGVELHANSHASARDIGLPAYPGATLYKDTDNDSAVDLGLNLGDFHFTLKAANYVSSDSPDRILAFYRKPLSRYGDVLECEHGKPVGAHTTTRSGLTCSDEQDGHAKANANASTSSDHEIRAGTPHQYRVVGIDKSQPGSTHFGLVYVDLPKDSDKKTD